MAINNIEEYLIERLLDLDPTLSSRQGSLMFVKVIDPLISRLGTDPIAIDVESFILQRLKDEFPELDVSSPGSTLRDIIVSPLILLLEPVRREIEFLRTQQSLANQSALTELELDAILANVFSQRMLGDYARGTVRVFFTTPYAAGIDPSISFQTSTGLLFVPEVTAVTNTTDFLRSGSQYYLDIHVRSTLPSTDHNISVGEINSVSGLQNVIRATNLRSFSGGVTQETNEEFLERAERSLSERSLNTKRGIETELLNSYSDIVSIDVVGFGEAEMQRDILQGEADFDLTESTGPLSYMTVAWRTHDVLNQGVEKHFPFTNTLVLKAPAGGVWADKTCKKIESSKFLRIAEGVSSTYDLPSLGRVRRIVEVYKHEQTQEYYIRTDDFEVYPKPLSIISYTEPVEISTESAEHGLNPASAQGSMFKMFTEVDGVPRVTGSYLPFTDIVETTYTGSQVPGSVIKGRDFLVTASAETFGDLPDGTGIGMLLPLRTRTYPLTRFFSAQRIGIGRTDSFLMSRNRYMYRPDTFVFDDTLDYCAINESPKIIDFGAPKYSAYPSESLSYDGVAYEEGGKNPGVMLEGKLVGVSGPGSIPDPSLWDQHVTGVNNGIQAPLHEADLILDRSQAPWDERGASRGQFIACTLYGVGTDFAFDGSLNNVDPNIVWQGTGVVDRVDEGDRWRLRVRGLDWTALNSLNLSGFSPSASASFTVLRSDRTNPGGNGFTENTDGQLIFANHPFELNVSLTVDTNPGVNLELTNISASVLERWYNPVTNELEPSTTDGTRSTITITADQADYDAPASNFVVKLKNASGQTVETGAIPAQLCQTPEDFVTAVLESINNAKIENGDTTDPQRDFLLEENLADQNPEQLSDLPSGKLVLRSLVYGNFPYEKGWSVVFENINGEMAIGGVTISDFTEVPNRSTEALAGQLWRQINHMTAAGLPFTADYDPSKPDSVVIRSTLPGSEGNNCGILPADWGAFSVTGWDGVLGSLDGVGNINGGFSCGFGPMLQVRGIVNDDDFNAVAHGALTGYEELTLSPSPSITTQNYNFTADLANKNIVFQRSQNDQTTYSRVIIEFIDGNGLPVRIVLDDNSAGALTANPTLSKETASFPMDAFSGTVEYGGGQVTIAVDEAQVTGAIPGNSLVLAAYSYYFHPYKLSWVLYRGALEVLDAQGLPSRSFDELAYAPSTRTTGRSHSTGFSGFNGDAFVQGDSAQGSWATCTSMDPYGSNNPTKGYWLRLGKGFNKIHPSLGRSPSAHLKGAEFLETNVEPTHAWEPQYLTERLGSQSIHAKTALPLCEGTMAIDFDADGVPTRNADAMLRNNTKAMSGFLIPVPMGTYTYEHPHYVDPNPITAGEALDHQVVQLFEGTSNEFGETRINISGIPGGVPMPGLTATNLEIGSGEVHIGGLTDVYLKPSASTEETTPVIRLSPSSPINGEGALVNGADIVLEASDGQVKPNVNASHFYSAELESALTGMFGPAPAYTQNVVLEIIEPPSPELLPRFVRVIHSVTGGCKIDGEYPATLGDGFENLRFRVMAQVTTSLDNPLNLLQQGGDLSINQNDLTVHFAGGLNFTTTPEDVGIYLHIDSDVGYGEYEINEINMHTAVLSKALPVTGSGLRYRIYAKQAGGVLMPLVRVREVSLSGDSLGVKVPYSKPVDAVASAFAGLNDDPVNEDMMSVEGGELKTEVVTLVDTDEIVPRCVFEVPGKDFREFGIIPFDVLVLPQMVEGSRYWFVDEIHQDGNDDYSRLILDRVEDLTGDLSLLTFIVGKPSIGTASVKFIDRTFFEITPETVFHYEDPGTGKKHFLRPSPAEVANVFKHSDNYTNIQISGNAPDTLVSVDDFFKHGVQEGDVVRIKSRVLQSAQYDGSAAVMEHESIHVAGKTLAVKINNTAKTVTFAGPNPVNISSIVNDINQQLGEHLNATVHSETVGGEPYYRIMIASINDVELITQGTIGILDDLKFVVGELDNTPSGESLIGDYKIASVEYQETAADGDPRTKLRLEAQIGAAAQLGANETKNVFIEVSRPGYQRVYPGDMSVDENGLYNADVKLTSFEPNTTSGIVPDASQLVVMGYKSLGYSLKVENNNYSYSIGEKVNLVSSPVILHETATSFENIYEVAGADVTISYDTAPTVDSVQNYMLNPNVRVVCNNPLVRHYFPAYPILTITYSGAMAEKAVLERLTSMMSSLYPNLPLESYAISSSLARTGATYLKSPLELGFIVHDADRNITVVRDQNRVALNKQTHIMEDMSKVTINKVG